MKNLKTFAQVNEAVKFVEIPKSMQRRIDDYTSKGWWMGKEMGKALSRVDIDLLDKALQDSLKYADRSASFIDITQMWNEPMIEFIEEVDHGSKKFEKAPESVPHQRSVGDNVYFNYATLVSSSDKMFAISDLEEFIKLNKKQKS